MNKSFIFLTSLLIVTSFGSPATGTPIVFPVPLPTELPSEWFTAMKKIKCKELVAKALVALESLLTLVEENDVRYVTFDDIREKAKIFLSVIGPVVYKSFRDELGDILKIIYLPQDAYEALVLWNQTPPIEQTEVNDFHYQSFRRFWTNQMKQPCLKNTNFLKVFMYYVFVFKPRVGKPISDTRVGFVRHAKRLKNIVVPPKAAAIEIVQLLRESLYGAILSEHGDLPINDSPDMAGSRKRHLIETTNANSEMTHTGDAEDEPRQSKTRMQMPDTTVAEHFEFRLDDSLKTSGITSGENTLPTVNSDYGLDAPAHSMPPQELHDDSSINPNTDDDTVDWDEILAYLLKNEENF